MLPVTTASGDKTELSPTNLVSGAAAVGADDVSAVEEFLHLLARAVRQFHTYPATSPLCTDAIAACHRAFAGLERRDRLEVRVTPTELVVDDLRLGAGNIVGHELVRRLHRGRVVALDIDRAATPRHLSHFCGAVIRAEGASAAKTTLAELLLEQGVDTIVAQMARRPEVVDLGAPPAPVCDLVGHEQRRRQEIVASGGRVDYLYPPDKGWVRLDPGTPLETVSLVDLAVLVDNPADVAQILLRLTDEDPAGADDASSALERKFSDVTTLFSSLDPRLARVMFSKLARAVLDLEPSRRTALLRRTILPGLLDGRADGTVLHDFPDVDLADSLCLLLELETAAPEVLTAALNRLDLPAERRQAVVPLIDARLSGGRPASAPSGEREIDRMARRLVRVDAAPGKDFSEFAAFDLSMDDHTMASLDDARVRIGETDLAGAQLRFLASLVRLEPNPTVVDGLLRRSMPIFAALERAGRWSELAESASRYREMATSLQASRPDVADAIGSALAAFVMPARAAALVDLWLRDDEGRRIARALIEAFGGAVVPGLVALVADPSQHAKAPTAVALLTEHASRLAPALVAHIDGPNAPVTRAVVKALGFAGLGYETAIAGALAHGDDQVAREALRALARIGSPQAAMLVTREILAGHAGRQAAAEEALWHFPPARTGTQVRQLLGDHDFVGRHPEAAARLLARAAHAGTAGLDDVLAALEPLRFHFWQPGVVKVALKARELRK